MRNSIRILVLAVSSTLALPTHAQNAEQKFWAHAGPVAVRFHTDTELKVGGAAVAGANASASNNISLGLELGYDITPAIALSMTLGIPPTTKLTGKGGPVDGLELGKVSYGPAVISGHYHFDFGSFKPYLGAGINYTQVMGASDGAVADLRVKSAWGSVLQAGFDVPVSKDWNVFFDVKQIFLETTAKGTVPAFGGVPAQAKIKLDPMLIHAGVGWYF
jgi:outer membrane protein